MPDIGFVTRNYPPQVGGLERAAYDWFQAISRIGPVRLLAHRGSKRGLPWFVLRAPWVLVGWRISGVRHVHLHDASLCIMLWPWLRLFPRVTCTVNGLDVCFPHLLYQFFWRKLQKGISLFLPISRATARACQERGVEPHRLKHMPDGLIPHPHPPLPKETARTILKQRFTPLMEAPLIIIWVGRMVPRKGLTWFIEAVLSRLGEHACLWVVGDGTELGAARHLAERLDLPVSFFGRVTDEDLRLLRTAADVAVVPNIAVPNDMEGFGLVSLEANDAGLWVLASDVDGIPDAVHDGHNGTLLPPSNADAWEEELRKWAGMDAACRHKTGKQARHYVHQHFAWEQLARRWWNEVLTEPENDKQ